jgi:hypothetical protein
MSWYALCNLGDAAIHPQDLERTPLRFGKTLPAGECARRHPVLRETVQSDESSYGDVVRESLAGSSESLVDGDHAYSIVDEFMVT